jgi:drug/metabolite transporter (DMT)-like permease
MQRKTREGGPPSDLARPADSREWLGTLLGILAIVFWSTTIAFGRRLTEEIGVWTATSAAFMMGGTISCVFWSARYGTPRALLRHRPTYLLGSGGLFVAYIICLYGAIGLATNRQQVLEVGVLNYLWPASVLVLSVPLQGFKPRPGLWVGILLAITGAVLALAQQGDLSWASWQRNLVTAPLPYVLAVCGALAWALYSNLSRKFGPTDGVGAQPVFVLATAAVLLLLRSMVHENSRWTTETLLLLAYNSIFPVTLAYAFWDYAMRTGKIVLLASLSYLIPILSTGISAMFLRLTPGVTLWAACVLVIGGAVVCRLSLREH